MIRKLKEIITIIFLLVLFIILLPIDPITPNGIDEWNPLPTVKDVISLQCLANEWRKTNKNKEITDWSFLDKSEPSYNAFGYYLFQTGFDGNAMYFHFGEMLNKRMKPKSIVYFSADQSQKHFNIELHSLYWASCFRIGSLLLEATLKDQISFSELLINNKYSIPFNFKKNTPEQEANMYELLNAGCKTEGNTLKIIGL